MRSTSHLFLLPAILVCIALFAGSGYARDFEEPKKAAEYRLKLREMKRVVLREAGTRHAKVGVWCRDAGLTQQAAAEFIKAVEVSEGENQWAQRILAIMRRLDDGFWKKKLKKPSGGMIRAYEKRAKKARKTYLKERLKLAKWADKKGIEKEAFDEFKFIVRLSDDYVEVDKDGLVVMALGKVPAKYSTMLLEDAVNINGRPCIRDAFLEKVPSIKDIFEAANDQVLIRSQTSIDQAKSYLAMCTALLPYLEADMGARPTRRLRMFIFEKRKDYEAYCDAAGHGSHKKAAGLADSGAFITIVSGEDGGEESVRGIALHELTHLYQYGVTPTIFPSWYAEGFAETYGGPGTFAWDGKKLTAGGSMSAHLIEPLRDDANYIPLKKMLKDNALKLINENKSSARMFYNQSWAFFRYLRKHADDEIRSRFLRYEMICRGAALGAKAGHHPGHHSDATDAIAYFDRLFGPDLASIETEFRSWLGEYKEGD